MRILLCIILILCYTVSIAQKNKIGLLNRDYVLDEKPIDNKLIIYQTLVRHFGNTNSTNKYYGALAENGVGKFDHYTDKALQEIQAMGFSHIWFTGVIEHATMTDYSDFGILSDDPDIVKGRAGSPYAIKDYYDVAPDLAVNVDRRMEEFEELVQRTHRNNMKVIIDFVPNHVARTYYSDRKPETVKDIGEDDNTNLAFSPTNDFYYIPNESFVVPYSYQAGGKDYKHALKDGVFNEFPAKVTGNNVFRSNPSQDDWFETVKLNYGVDFENGSKTYFNPIPPLWFKMRDILLYWASKGVDGFRCDMIEMVPVEFWSWALEEIRREYPEIIFIGEAYNKSDYAKFYDIGKFDYLYDKVGLYDTLKLLIRNEDSRGIQGVQDVWQKEVKGYSSRMLRFLENHDEQRIASKDFAANPWLAVPAMVLSTTMYSGPVMLYAGQEVGEAGLGQEGFGGEDGRTTIFDYWGVPQHQMWMNSGRFDGAQLTQEEIKLREFYKKLFLIAKDEQAIRQGGFYDLILAQPEESLLSNRIYAYIRYTDSEKILVVTNFEKSEQEVVLSFPVDVIQAFGLTNSKIAMNELLSGDTIEIDFSEQKIVFKLPAHEAFIFKF